MKKIITLFSLMLMVASAHSQMIYFKGILQGSQEVPPTPSTASGVVIVTYDTMRNILHLSGNYNGLTSTASASHIHSPAPAGSNAPILFPLQISGGTTGTISGTDTLTQEQEVDLMNGLMYVNVHSSNFPAGEIRTQLMMATSGQTDYFSGRLQGAQQVPPNGSPGMGSVVALLDRGTDSVFLTGSFSGLTAPATASHIHKAGLPGVNGPVFQDLVFSPDVMGTLHVAELITAENITQMVNGMTYVNIHNTNFPGGEIRAQLTMLSQMHFFKAMLQGSQEVPPTESAAMGTVIVKYNSETNVLELRGDYQNLTEESIAAHIHSPAPVGANAPVLFPLTFTLGTSGVLTDTVTLTEEQELDLMNGLMYVNVHSTRYPDGEIRGQITPASLDAHYFTGNLQGSQEVPPNTSTATGAVTVLLDRMTDSVFVTGNYNDLTTPATMGHIHKGPAGVSGPVIVPLSVTLATSGTVTGSGLVSPSFADSMVMGYSYVNVHTSTYPAGEIRAQLGDLVLPVHLLYFNGYKDANGMTLLWATALEVNLRSFEVQQQDAATGAWVTKATVGAIGGNNASQTQYKVTDVPTPGKNGMVLYRLKMTDADGKVTYSSVISIPFDQSKAVLTIVPNPVVNGVLQFTITGLAAEQKATVRVVDYNGRTVANGTMSTLQNNRLSVSQLPAGLYKLVVSFNGTILQKTFSKQ